MKPIKLKMEGFGPFLEETQIDFSQLGEGLTLISGSTGAGKTTIFDAICCALFGETSGRRRSFSEMRSKSAGPKDETRVAFAFELRGEEYYIERSPGYAREKIRGEGVTTVPARASLVLPSGKVVEKPNQVTEAIVSLLGIERHEFRQIVMIAQNEFMGMITGTNTEQEKTFNRIFGAELYQNFDKRVHEEAKRLGEEWERSLERLRMLLSDYTDTFQIVPDDLGSVDTELSAVREKIETELNEYRPQYEKISADLQQNQLLLARAQELEEKYLKRESLIAKLTKRQEDAKTVEHFVRDKASAEVARDVLLQPYNELESLKSRYNELDNEHQRKRAEYKKSRLELKEIEHKLSGFSQARLDEHTAHVDRLESKISQYRNAEQTREELKKRKVEYESVASRELELTQRQSEFNKILEDTEVRPNSYFLLGTERLREEKSRYEQGLEKAEAILKDVKEIFERLVELYELQDYVADQKTCQLRAHERADQVLRSYSENSAAFLARSLKDGVDCPVCGSPTHPNPATPTDENATIEDVEAAQKAVEIADKKFSETLAEYDQVRGRVQIYRENVEKVQLTEVIKENFEIFKLEDFCRSVDRALADEPDGLKRDYTSLIEALEELISTFKNRLDELKAESLALEEESKQNEKLAYLVEETTKKKASLGTEIDEIRAEKDEKRQGVVKVASALETLCADLEYESEEEALAELSKRKNLRDEYKRNFESTREKKTKIEREHAEIVTYGKSLAEQKEKTKVVIEDREKQFEKLLVENDFTAQSFYEARLRIEQIEKYQEYIDRYENDCRYLSGMIQSLEDELKGQERPDISALKESLKRVSAEEKACTSKLRLLEGKRERIIELSEKAAKMIPIIEKQREKADSIARLDGVVNKKGENFAQYVLSRFFSLVLDRANQKLSTMTDGLYRLRQPAAGKLGVEVYDSNTNTTRDVKTLSGGEMFMASLALALGFSEAVEEQNGGVRLDTVFIDEGFGSLDPDYLDKSLQVLSELTGDRRVAIISHVEFLKERIPQQIIVTKEHDCSRIEVKLC